MNSSLVGRLQPGDFLQLEEQVFGNGYFTAQTDERNGERAGTIQKDRSRAGPSGPFLKDIIEKKV